MFQWMGGSRRKVTASRKSTHKRQKQYFEQKKRQLQQQPAWQDISIIGENLAKEEKNYKSLDITSLLNLTENAKKCQSNCLNTVDCSEVDLHENERFHSKIPTYYSQRTPTEFVCIDHDGLSSEIPVDSTILDILLDDVPSFEFRQYPTYESHVTFSFEGVGKLRTETIANTSPQHGRVPNCHHSTRKLPTHKKFNSMNDDFEFGAIEITDHYDSYWMSPLRSPGRVDSFLSTRQDLSALESTLKYEKIYNKSIDFIGGESFFSTELPSDSAWNDKSSLLDERLFHGSDCNKPWENPPLGFDDFSVEFLDNRNCLLSDDGFKRGIKRRYVKESTSPFGSFSIREDDEDVADLCMPRVGKHIYFENMVKNQPTHHGFMDEDMKDLPSEESCSSSAVIEEDNNFTSHPMRIEQIGRRPVRTFQAQTFLSREPGKAVEGSKKPKMAPSGGWMSSFGFDMPYSTPSGVSGRAEPSSLNNFDMETSFSFLKPDDISLFGDPFPVKRSASSALDSRDFPGFSDTSPLRNVAGGYVAKKRENVPLNPPFSAVNTVRRNLNMNFVGEGGSVSSENEKPQHVEDVCGEEEETKVEASPIEGDCDDGDGDGDEFRGKNDEKRGLQMSQYTQDGGVEEKGGEREDNGTTTMTMMMESHVLRLLLVHQK